MGADDFNIFDFMGNIPTSPYEIRTKTKDACKIYTLNGLWNLYYEYRWALFCIFIGLGIFLCFLSCIVEKIVMFTLAMLMASFFGMWIASIKDPIEKFDTIQNYSLQLGISFLVGVLFGLLLLKFH